MLLGRPFGRLRPGGRQMDVLMRFACLSICASDGSGNSVPSYCSFQCVVINSGHMMCIMLTPAATAAACACEHGIFVRTTHRLSQAAGPPFLVVVHLSDHNRVRWTTTFLTSFRSTRTFLLEAPPRRTALSRELFRRSSAVLVGISLFVFSSSSNERERNAFL